MSVPWAFWYIVCMRRALKSLRTRNGGTAWIFTLQPQGWTRAQTAWLFSLQQSFMICWKSAKWGTFPKIPQTQQHWVLFLKWNVKTTSFSDKVTTWHFVGTETAFFLLYPSLFPLLCHDAHRVAVKHPFDYFWKNSHERFALPCLESL